jgi:protein TonB
MPRCSGLFRLLGTSSPFVRALRSAVRWALLTGALAAALGAAACRGAEHGMRETAVPRERAPLPAARVADAAELASGTVPRMLNAEPPFRYPAELYARRVQGNVMLRLHVDSTGRVHPDSTSIVASSGIPALDSAAVRGAAALEFAPAVRDGHPVGLTIRFPVHFRHPAAPPLPGDGVGRP